MIWLLELALALAVVGGGWTLLSRGRRGDDRDALTMRRVDAYIETIRRERSNRELSAMSDTELRDLLHSGARNFRINRQRKNWTLLGAGLAALIAAAVAADQSGLSGFAVAVAIGAVVVYGLNEFLERRLRQPLEGHGVEIERLLVE